MLLGRARNLVRELRRAREVVADRRSARQLTSDMVSVKVLRRLEFLRRFGVAPSKKTRTIQLRGGLTVDYRLNFGDVQSIREVWLDECYRLPYSIDARTFVDLGANIGLATLWFWRTYRPARMVAVEAVASNARLARKTFADNGVAVHLIEAAVGPSDGSCAFAESDESNLGRAMPGGGLIVPMVSMDTVLASLPTGTVVDVLKMDIEGGEEALLLGGNVEWLERVRSLIVEFHPPIVDRDRLIAFLASRGFEHIPPNTVFPNNYEAFVRPVAKAN